MYISLNGEWQLTGWWKHQWRGFAHELGISENLVPTVGPLSVRVPGAVHCSLIEAGILKEPNIGLNSIHCEWVNNREWLYDKRIALPSQVDVHKIFLCFDGLDHCGEVYLNGKKILVFDGMFLEHRLDVTGVLHWGGENFLRVIFYQTPEVDGQYGYSSRISILKSRFNYIWDWCPRIVPTGIWQDVFLRGIRSLSITDFYPKALCGSEDSEGRIQIQLDLDVFVPGEYVVTYRVTSEGETVITHSFRKTLAACFNSIEHTLYLKDIRLWWPNSMGMQKLYSIEVSVFDYDGILCDQRQKQIGFRTFILESNPHSPPGALPYTARINGKRVFLRGVNWVPISPFYGSVTRKQYEDILKRFKDMNCNLLRVWGGAILEKADFYELCDEMGLMVWQEFPQSSSGIDNTPPLDPEFLEKLERTARTFLRLRRHHACHILWCGGNELMYEDYTPVDTHNPNIKLLQSIVQDMDKEKSFLPSSASGPVFVAKLEDFGKGIHHDVHGPWNYYGHTDHYAFFNHDDALFRSEVGCPGTSRLETLMRYRGEMELWPPDKRNPYWVHRGAWWLQLGQLTELFGPWAEDGSELEQYIQASRYLQAEALRYAVEATRRREPQSSGLIICLGNEPFPNNVSISILEYDGTPKPAYYLVQNAFASVHVSARYEKIAYTPGEDFSASVYLHSDRVNYESYIIKASIYNIHGQELEKAIWSVTDENSVVLVSSLCWKVSVSNEEIFLLTLNCQKEEHTVSENSYIFTTDINHPFRPLRRLPQCAVETGRNFNNHKIWDITNKSQFIAVGIFLYGKNPEDFLTAFPNYFILFPGETKEVCIQVKRAFGELERPFNLSTL